MSLFSSDYALGVLSSERKLTNNDGDLERSFEDGIVQTRLPNGNLVSYNLYQRLHWKFTYSYIFGEDKYIYDGGMGRNSLYALYTTLTTSYSFLEPNDQGAATAYTVKFVPNSWSESLIYRDGDKWAWQIAFELIQT